MSTLSEYRSLSKYQSFTMELAVNPSPYWKGSMPLAKNVTLLEKLPGRIESLERSIAYGERTRGTKK